LEKIDKFLKRNEDALLAMQVATKPPGATSLSTSSSSSSSSRGSSDRATPASLSMGDLQRVNDEKKQKEKERKAAARHHGKHYHGGKEKESKSVGDTDNSNDNNHDDGTRIPVVICGDYNSTPDSDVYGLMASGYCAPANMVALSPNPDSKIICDSDLNKVCRWLRAIGVDAEFWQSSDGNIEDLFTKAIVQERIIITKSSNVIVRR
jgi:hypothetical protein